MSFHDIIFALGFAVCHQLPERCTELGGELFPLCARCLGTYLGAFLGYLYILISGKWRANDLPKPRFAIILLCFLALIFIDVITLWLKLRPESAPLRTLTGLTTGGVLPMLAYPLIMDELFPHRPLSSVMEHWWQFVLFCSLLALTLAAVYLGPGWFFYPLVIAATLGIMGIFFNTIYVVLLLIFHPQKLLWKIMLALAGIVLAASLLTFLYWLHQKALAFAQDAGLM